MQSLVINNYKNFENLTLGNLANVNLIVGKNNLLCQDCSSWNSR